jgi:hypothetical protein
VTDIKEVERVKDFENKIYTQFTKEKAAGR